VLHRAIALGVATVPCHNFPERKLTPVDLAAWPILTLGRASNPHNVIEAWFRKHGARPRQIDVCNSLGVVASLTMAGLGIAMLPPSIFAGDQRLKTLETVPRLKDQEFVAVYPRNTGSPLISFIVDMAQTLSTFDAPA
jgi:DNA-binding transcriptional LysR family regulator